MVLIVILLVFVSNSITFAKVNQWIWTTDKGTFVINERIAKRLADGEKIKIVSNILP